MWSRGLVLICLAAGAIAGGAVIADQAAAQAPGERVVVTPAEGTAFTRFRFLGSGFVAWPQVSVQIVTPDGIGRRLVDERGTELVWQPRFDGSFEIDFVPAQYFPSAPPGRWTALFCGVLPPPPSVDQPPAAAPALSTTDVPAAQPTQAPTCQRLRFDVLLVAPR